jgi:hypothetical protein
MLKKIYTEHFELPIIFANANAKSKGDKETETERQPAAWTMQHQQQRWVFFLLLFPLSQPQPLVPFEVAGCCRAFWLLVF